MDKPNKIPPPKDVKERVLGMLPENDNKEGVPENDNEKTVSLLEQARVDYTEEVEQPPEAMRINGGTFGTLGNFSLVIGKAKSKKTFLVTMALAGAVKGELVSDVFKGMLPEDKNRVVFVDTEQAKYDVAQVGQRVMELTGVNEPPNFEVFGLRPFSTGERNKIIEQIIKTSPDLGLLVIDGVRDVVSSINDEEQATELANKLLKWTEERQIHIVTVLHQNKGDYNARGHLGTELVNKAELTVSVTKEPKNKAISKVEAEYCRHKEFEPFAIWVNGRGLPERVEGWQPRDENKATGKKDPNEVNKLQRGQILREVKSNVKDKPKLSDMRRQIKASVGKHVQSIGETKAKDYFRYYKNEGFIVKHGKDRSPNTYYEIKLLDHAE